MSNCLEALARVAASQGAIDRSRAEDEARLRGGADALREAIGSPLPPGDRDDHERSLAAAVATLGIEAFGAARPEGHAMLPEEILGLALRLV